MIFQIEGLIQRLSRAEETIINPFKYDCKMFGWVDKNCLSNK